MAQKKIEGTNLDTQNGVLSILERIIKMMDKYGILKMIFAILFLIFMAYAAYIVLNPDTIFEKYTEYIDKQHNSSIEYRLQASPLIQGHLDNLLVSSRASRAFIVEMHNGKNNPSGLSFIYGSLNYESLNDSAESIMEDYKDFSLERFTLASKVFRDGYWSGSINDLMKIDKRLAYRIESNGSNYIAVTMIYGTQEDIGFLGVTYTDKQEIDSVEIKKELLKYSAKISPLLDGKKNKEE